MIVNVKRAVLVSLLALVPAAAFADTNSNSFSFPSCGTVVNRNTSHQFGSFAWVEYIVETQGVFDICLQVLVIADADMPGVAGSALHAQGLLYATARRQVPVPSYRIWQTNGHHYVAYTPSPGTVITLHTGETASFADVVPPTRTRDREQECFERGGEWSGGTCILKNSPLIVNGDGHGYRLTSVDEGVRFDLDADGTPELVAWTAAGSEDGFLAIDRNGNGTIDDGSELMGDRMRIAMAMEATAANGFEALKFLESPLNGLVSCADGVIDARDSTWSQLLLWRDRNHNGISEPDELETVAAAGLAAIGTDYKTSRKRDRFGNEFRQAGWLTWADGTSARIYDVWLIAHP
jgi:hypothetical protein